MSKVEEIEAAIRSLSAGEKRQLADDLPVILVGEDYSKLKTSACAYRVD